MYGGGFAAAPAYLADIFGTQFVGAIHGRLLTAWSTAGLVGPILVGYASLHARQAGVAQADVYDQTLYAMAGLLAVGFIANLLVRPLTQRWFMTPAESAAVQDIHSATVEGRFGGIGLGGLSAGVAAAWLCVLLPIAWGLYMTLSKVGGLF